MFYRILRNVIFIAFLLAYVYGECKISLRSKARFYKDFGTRNVEIRKKAGDVLKLSENDTIIVICTTTLRLETANGFLYKIKSEDPATQFLCNHKLQLELQKNSSAEFESLHAHEVFLTCDRPKRYLWESYTGWPNCEPFTTYSVARSGIGFSIAMGFCYDFDSLTLKFATYSAYWDTFIRRSDVSDIDDYQRVELNIKLTSLQSYFDFMSPDTFNASLLELKSEHEVLSMYEFDLGNLIQDEPMDQYVHDFDYILNIVWWRNLRLGNWKNYLNALFNRTTQTQDYLVYTGTHGIIELPALLSDNIEQMTFTAGNAHVHAPEYIWSYLQSLKEPGNKAERVVVIGHNSPFFASNRNVIFCEDICDQFDWLSSSTKFGKLRLMPTMGVVFCCRPEDVANKFKPFPYAK